jgi:hypothetical protein
MTTSSLKKLKNARKYESFNFLQILYINTLLTFTVNISERLAVRTVNGEHIWHDGRP